MARCWYAYVGGTAGDPTQSRNFIKLTGKPGCFNGPFVCAIYAEGCGTTPFAPLSSNLQTYIANALSGLVAEPQLPVGSEIFVYMKSTS